MIAFLLTPSMNDEEDVALSDETVDRAYAKRIEALITIKSSLTIIAISTTLSTPPYHLSQCSQYISEPTQI